jgi:hypothetical protein
MGSRKVTNHMTPMKRGAFLMKVGSITKAGFLSSAGNSLFKVKLFA